MPSVGVTPTYTAGKYASLLGKCETSSTSFSNHLQTIHLTRDHCGGWRIYSVNVKQDAPNQDFNLKKTRKHEARPLGRIDKPVVVHSSIVCLHVDQHNELHKHLSTHKTSGLWLLV